MLLLGLDDLASDAPDQAIDPAHCHRNPDPSAAARNELAPRRPGDLKP